MDAAAIPSDVRAVDEPRLECVLGVGRNEVKDRHPVANVARTW
jgi:hypothetical protein